LVENSPAVIIGAMLIRHPLSAAKDLGAVPIGMVLHSLQTKLGYRI